MTTSDLRIILTVNAKPIHDAIFADTNGFVLLPEGDVVRLLNSAGYWLGPRNDLEKLPAFRQLIPYVVTVVEDKIVAYERTPKGGEARLHGKLAIGLGGHIDLGDATSNADGHFDILATLHKATERELIEEIGGHNLGGAKIAGIIVMNTTEVDQVHLGVVVVQHMDELPAREAEDAIGNLQTLTIEELAAEEARLENWTKTLLPHLAALKG